MQNKKLIIIGCGVLDWNLRQLIPALGEENFRVRILPAQLHNNPRRLREMLQAEIDRLESEAASYRGICLAYGVCGRGIIGLESRSLPLVVPRVQDCIGLCLGSHRRYSAQFDQQPGTRYMTPGWYQSINLEDGKEHDFLSARDHSLYGPSYLQLKDKYGAENAAFICRFRESWKESYRRAAYISFPPDLRRSASAEPSEEEAPGRAITRAMARELGWEFADLVGDHSLLQSMLAGDWKRPELLLVPAHCTIVPAPGEEVLSYTSQTDSAAILDRYNGNRSNRAVIRRTGLGLGIDTGGTFTDAVLYDFDRDSVLATAKSPTTHERLIDGIAGVLNQLPRSLVSRVGRVGLSTTLATNALVERKGRKVALLLMSPVGIDLGQLPFQVVEQIAGVMTIDGRESQPVDHDQVVRVARRAVALDCEAFAVSGFAGVVNPAHELAVAEIAFRTTGLHAVCGHQLTSELNFMERATTAAMNAKLVPLIEDLLRSVRQALNELGLAQVRLMVVKGDGSQILDRVAVDFPVETVMSGPAASVVGASRVSGLETAVVADIGGTTLDVALLRHGRPVVSRRGARIVDFQTSVRAIAMHTTGLGGDSEIDLENWPRVRIGPRRIVPICRFPFDFPRHLAVVEGVFERQLGLEPQVLEWASLVPGKVFGEVPLLRALAAGPGHLPSLAEGLNRPGAGFIKWRDYEDSGQLRRYGLTLTDILHWQRHYTAFNRVFSVKLLGKWAELLGVDIETVGAAILDEFRKRVGIEIIGALAPADCPWKESGNQFVDWLAGSLAVAGGRRDADFAFSFSSGIPVVPVGAPAPALFPAIGQTIGVAVKIPQYAGVTNAIGAIAGNVILREIATIRFGDGNALVCSWRGGMKRASNLETALAIAEGQLRQRMKQEAAANHISFSEPVFSAAAREASTRDGKILLGVDLVAEISG